MVSQSEMSAGLDRVLELVVVLGADMAHGLGELGLTEPRAHLVWQLHHAGPTTQSALAQALGVTPRNITGLVDGLVDQGLVTREPHPSDRRATLVALTTEGQRVAERLAADQQDFARLLFDRMPSKQLEAFVATLDEILGRLREAGAHHGA